MSKKRTNESCQSAADEQTHNGDAPDVPQDDNAKRVKLTPFMSDMTLEDLPIELLESILIKVIAMEVKSMKLAKSVWKEKAELVINRLEDVCSQWSNVLATNGFRTRLHRALEDIGEGTIRLEILQQYTIPSDMSAVTAFRDEVFVLYRRYREDDYINVYDWGNMAEVKYVIPLPGFDAENIVSCTVSNCVYIVNRKLRELRDHFSIHRISGESVPRWSTVSEVIEDLYLPDRNFCVAANGSLIFSRKQTLRIPAISVYNANGSLQQTIRLPSDITDFYEMIPKPNGNLVLSRRPFYEDGNDDNDDDNNDNDDDDDNNDDDNDDNNDDDDNDDDDDDDNDDDYKWQATLTEIDMNGTKIRQDLVSLDDVEGLDLHSSIVGSHGRMMVVSERNGIQLLDSEFNVMDLRGPQLIGPGLAVFAYCFTFLYNSERKETIMIDNDVDMDQADVTVFQLEEQ